jgi:hypothetical protein
MDPERAASDWMTELYKLTAERKCSTFGMSLLANEQESIFISGSETL